ncbi:MAG: substrate-binding domain-containing protein [Desulfobacterales bacterium]|jgi:tungstate transport system substrate-binding protein
MKRKAMLATAAILLISGLFCTNLPAQDKILKMSTTTSTQASGLLDVLLPALEEETGIQVKVFAKGTGAAIRDGMDGNVDVIFVHARAREEQFVAEGYGTKRYAVMHNDFVILGPPSDPAGVKGMKDAAAALKKIARSGSAFISRGDDSGTHTKEQDLWKATGLPLEKNSMSIVKKGKSVEVSFLSPQGLGQWYQSIGQGMGKTLTFADEKRAYTLADRGTYLKYKYGSQTPIDLEVLCEGDPALFNPYGVIPVNPEKFPHVRYDLAKQFAEWLISPKTQQRIADYRLLGKPLFIPDNL